MVVESPLQANTPPLKQIPKGVCFFAQKYPQISEESGGFGLLLRRLS